MTYQPAQTREQQLQRWLFCAMRGLNGATNIRAEVIREHLSLSMGADNTVVAQRAAHELARLESKRMVR